MTRLLWRRMRQQTGTYITLEGELPSGAALFATNATHKMDWFFFQELFMDAGRRAPIVSKGKNWHDPMARFGCRFFDALPLVSRGYILSVDARHTLGHRPDEALYRALRDHMDHDAPLDPHNPDHRAMLTTPREVLGSSFDPQLQSYRAFARELYYRFQRDHLIRLAAELTERGHGVHIYPQGSVSSRLSRGRIGAVQLAWALKVPIVPIGLSGAAQAFAFSGLPLLRGAPVTIRIGEPIDLRDHLALPSSFRPFHPDDEAAHREALQQATDEIMERLNALLDASCQGAPDRQSDGKQGVKRFL